MPDQCGEFSEGRMQYIQFTMANGSPGCTLEAPGVLLKADDICTLLHAN